MARALFVGVLVLVFAQTAFGLSSEELFEAKQLIDSNPSCESLSDKQFELIGEYVMEQMHPGEAHEFMDQMMGLEEGSQEHKDFHVNLAKTFYCRTTSAGAYTYGGMMGFWRNYGDFNDERVWKLSLPKPIFFKLFNYWLYT